MSHPPPSRFSNKLKWTVVITLLAIGLYTAFGFWGVPALVQSTVLPKLSQHLGLTLSAQKVRANPFHLSLGFENLSISHTDGSQLADATDLALNVSARSLFFFKPVLQSIVIDTPDLNLIRNKSGALNWPTAKSAPPATAPANDTTDEKPPAFWINRVAVHNGSITFNDVSVDFRHQVNDLNVTVEDLGFHKKKAVHVDLSARYNEAPINVNGDLRLFDPAPEAKLNVRVESLALPTFLTYLPTKPAATLSSGFISTRLDIDFDTKKPPADHLLIKGGVTLEKVAIADLNKEAIISLPKAAAVINEAYPFHNQWRIETVTLEEPSVRIERSGDGTLNLAHLAPAPAKTSDFQASSNQPSPASETTETRPTLDLLIRSIELQEGRIDYADASWPQPFEKHFTGVTLQVTDFTFTKDALVPVTLNFKTQADETAVFDGKLGLMPFILEGDVSLTQVKLADYLPFYHSMIGFDYQDGRGDANGRIYFDTQNGPLTWALTDITLDLRDIVLTDRRSGQIAIHTKQLTAQQCDLIPAEKMLRFGKLNSSGGSLEIIREASGNINLASLFSSPEAEPAGKPQTAKKSAPPDEEETSASWQVRLETVALDNQAFVFSDETVTPGLMLEMAPTAVNAQNLVIGRPEKSQFTITSKIGPKGKIQIKGALQIKPFILESAVTTKALEMAPFQPYLPENINIGLTSGTLFTNGRLKMVLPQGNPFQLSVDGDLVVRDLSSVNTRTEQSLLDFKTLDIKNAKLDITPFALSSQQIALTDFVSHITVAPDGQHNFKGLFGKPESANVPTPPMSASAATNNKALPVNIGHITLQNGRIIFSDQFTQPNFDARLSRIEGHINNMNPVSPADIKMTGLWEDLEPVEIEGSLNPFTKYPQTLLNLSIKGLSLSPFSPYSGKYLGRNISRGNLSLDLKYKVDGSQLAGENIAVIDDLDLGAAVDSPDAVSLPVGLVISLLKDLNNDIHLDLPVSGDLADPKFRLGRTILRMLGNLITKVVTAPFTVIGALFGGGESLGHVDFEPGKSDLIPSEIKKLEALTNVLEKKSTLRLDISGDANPERDAKALRQYKYYQMIATVKKPVLEKRSADIISARADYEKRVKKLYKQMASSLPPTSGSNKKPTIVEMEKAMLEQIAITDDDLRNLANQRARAVEGFFLTQKQLDPSRFFVIQPDIPPTEKEGPAPAGQVRFSLR